MSEFLIETKKGPYIIFLDDEDDHFMSEYTWGIHDQGMGRTKYVVAHIYKGLSTNKNHKRRYYQEQIRLHRLVLGLKKGDKIEVDHIDGDGLDNRKSNLRLATDQQNACNSKPIRKNNTTGYKGVHFVPKSSKFRARITYKQRRYLLGDFKNVIDAAKAYNEAALQYFGEFARLNVIK